MKKVAVLILLSILLSGCITQKKCAERFPPVESTRDSIRDSLVFQDRLVPLYVASDSGYLKAWIDCQNSKPVITQMTQGGGTHIRTGLTQSGAVFTFTARIDSFAVFKAVRDRSYYQKVYSGKVVVKVSYMKTGWDWFQIYGFRIGTTIILLILLIWFITKKWRVILGALKLTRTLS